MVKFNIKHSDSYSRGQLLLRSLFGWLYILIPHAFVLMFIGMGVGIMRFLAFWSILFTGKYPESWFNFQVQALRWQTRVNASLFNLSDEYPAFGLSAEAADVELEIAYPTEISRGEVLVRALFGWIYIMIPHMIILIFRILGTEILMFFAFWVVLITGSYPESWHRFNVGTLRWGVRLNAYLSYLTHQYPPFSGQE